MKYEVLVDVCDDINKGDKVVIISPYSYMVGTDNIRIKDYFKLLPGEVVISKNIFFKEGNRKERMTLAKCQRSSLVAIK